MIPAPEVTRVERIDDVRIPLFRATAEWKCRIFALDGYRQSFVEYK